MKKQCLWVCGSPLEGGEGKPIGFVEPWLITIFSKPALTPLFAHECAHHKPMQPPGCPPRLILAQVLNYNDRGIILRVDRVRKAFMSILTSKRRYDDNVPNLAKLRIIVSCQSHFCKSANDASPWLDLNKATL